ncbi:MAG: SMC-Scp complex subunit ScpB [Saprospiraceae bacterium]|nr:SMC-Scp complex subunit ScpB [Saprospiraceae bacterium]
MTLDLHIESLIFAAEKPITTKEITQCLENALETNVKPKDTEAAIDRLKEKFAGENFAFELVEINGGFAFLTKGAYHHVVGQFLKQQTRKMLSRAALETLAIVAYKQPVTKVDIERIRGVNCDYTIQKLLDKELVILTGRAEGPGRPLLYSTSDKFMDYFGLKSLADLPKLKEFRKPDNEIGSSTSLVEDAIANSSEN